jgi:hypothetical protein
MCKLFLFPSSAKMLNNTTKRQHNMQRTKLEVSSAFKGNNKKMYNIILDIRKQRQMKIAHTN